MNKIDVSKVKECADYIRYLSLESIQRANSGHPGLPLGCAELGVLLYRYILNINPAEPEWLNRDRFILSAGHGSMLLYSLLYLAGYELSLKDLEEFRQLRSNTPGHPEYNIRHGIETTTGPLGQGFANAVGCAIEGKILAERFNEKGFDLFNYTVYTLMGDGCNMEGISYEAASLAGHLGLDNLIAIYDANDISIDGETNITFSDDIPCRYKGLGWHTETASIKDIEDTLAKLEKLKTIKDKPKILVLKTTIGEGLNKKKNTAAIHGSPAGPDEIAYFIKNSWVKKLFQKKYGDAAVDDPQALVEIIKQRCQKPKQESLLEAPECTAFMRAEADKRKTLYNEWQSSLENYRKEFPQKHESLSAYTHFHLPESLKKELLDYKSFKNENEIKPTAVRGIAGKVLDLCAKAIPQMLGGSADLTDSTKAKIEETTPITRQNFSGRKIYYGVREHAMGAVGNGIALNRISIPFCSTFFTFFDYMKPAVRLAALMRLNHIFVFSHDSIYVGEDGPTHQPIEHLNALRLIPDIYTFRPANDVETAFAYLYFLQEMNGPIALVTTRQNLPKEVFIPSPHWGANREALYEQFRKGAYIFYETPGTGKPDIIFAASGSEVALALQTAKMVEEKKQKKARVVSIPCLELFERADKTYRQQLLLEAPVPLVVIEAGSHRGVKLFYDPRTILVDIETFGESAPDNDVASHFGFTPEAILHAALPEGL